MSLDAIHKIRDAEQRAEAARRDALDTAERMIKDATRQGEEAVAASEARAESEVATLLRSAEQKAAMAATELANQTINREATLRAHAEARLDKAALIIAERIVNS